MAMDFLNGLGAKKKLPFGTEMGFRPSIVQGKREVGLSKNIVTFYDVESMNVKVELKTISSKAKKAKKTGLSLFSE